MGKLIRYAFFRSGPYRLYNGGFIAGGVFTLIVIVWLLYLSHEIKKLNDGFPKIPAKEIRAAAQANADAAAKVLKNPAILWHLPDNELVARYRDSVLNQLLQQFANSEKVSLGETNASSNSGATEFDTSFTLIVLEGKVRFDGHLSSLATPSVREGFLSLDIKGHTVVVDDATGLRPWNDDEAIAEARALLVEIQSGNAAPDVSYRFPFLYDDADYQFPDPFSKGSSRTMPAPKLTITQAVSLAANGAIISIPGHCL